MSFSGRFLSRPLKSIILDGEVVDNAIAGTTGNIKVLQRDGSKKILLATGTDVPTDSTAGYAKGCKFIDTDVAAGTGGAYENVGTSAECNFDIMGTITAGSVDTTELAADAVTGDKIEDDAISAEHLDAGILPSHIVVYSGEVTWTGGGTSIATTVTGALATDIVQATIQTVPSEAAYLVSCAVTDNTVTTTLSAANTTNDAVIAYTVLRAVA